MSKGILYYTCNTHKEDIEMVCRKNLSIARGDLFLGTVSREPIDFGDWNIVIPDERSPLTMHKQIAAGLERMQTDFVFLCESDVLYSPTHFDFTPDNHIVVYYNTNIWKIRYPDGHAVWTDHLQQVSGICADRKLLLDFYISRIMDIERNGFNRHYEPNRRYGIRTGNWQSAEPNLDIRHDQTLTRSKWSPDEFRNKRYANGWKETDQFVEYFRSLFNDRS